MIKINKIYCFNRNVYPENCRKILIGNKSDKEGLRQVDYEIAKKFATDNDMKYFECSALNGENIEDIFRELAWDIHTSVALDPKDIPCFFLFLIQF